MKDLNIYMLPCSQILHKKTAAALCLTTVKNEDKLEFSKILEAIKVYQKIHADDIHVHTVFLLIWFVNAHDIRCLIF